MNQIPRSREEMLEAAEDLANAGDLDGLRRYITALQQQGLDDYAEMAGSYLELAFMEKQQRS